MMIHGGLFRAYCRPNNFSHKREFNSFKRVLICYKKTLIFFYYYLTSLYYRIILLSCWQEVECVKSASGLVVIKPAMR